MSAIIPYRYNGKRVSVLIGGVPATDFGENDIVEIIPEADISELSTTADGNVIITDTNNKVQMATVTLSAGSPSIPIFESYINLYESSVLAPNLATVDRPGTFNFSVIDNNTGSIYSSNSCNVFRSPDTTLGLKPGEKQYKVVMPLPSNLIVG